MVDMKQISKTEKKTFMSSFKIYIEKDEARRRSNAFFINSPPPPISQLLRGFFI
jgi:hypothetical protein